MITEKQPKSRNPSISPALVSQSPDQMPVLETPQIQQHHHLHAPQNVLRLQRMLGNQKTISLLHRRTSPQRVLSHAMPSQIQRETIIVNGKDVHINDYHLISRMDRVKSIGVSKTSHTLILEDIDFDGLAEAAKKAKGKGFDYAGYTWGWKGPKELFPEPKKHVTVELSGNQIQALLQCIRDEEAPNKKDPDLAKAYEAWLLFSKQKSKSSKIMIEEKFEIEDEKEITTTLNITISTKDLPDGVTLVEGKTGQGFLMGPNGSKKEYPHIHFFFNPPIVKEEKTSKKSVKVKDKKTKHEKNGLPETLTIKTAHATLRPTKETGENKRGWDIGSNLKVIRVLKEGEHDDDDEVIGELENALLRLYQSSNKSEIEETIDEGIGDVDHVTMANYLSKKHTNTKITAKIIPMAMEESFKLKDYEPKDFENMVLTELADILYDYGYIEDVLKKVGQKDNEEGKKEKNSENNGEGEF